MYYPDQTRPVVPVTADEVRRIVREELDKMKGSA